MINFGDVPIGTVLPVMFSSYDANGASVALSGLAVTDIEIYKGTSMTQRSSDAGYALLDTDGIDIDGIVGANAFSIDTGDNTDAGFYAAGSYYFVWVASVTIAGQTVNVCVAWFRAVPAESSAGVRKVDVSHFGGTAGTFAAGLPDANAASLKTQAKADVNAEVVDALNVDTYAEPGQGAPLATASLAAKIGYLFKLLRNKKTQTATDFKLFNDAETVVDQKSAITQAAGTVTRGELVSGP